MVKKNSKYWFKMHEITLTSLFTTMRNISGKFVEKIKNTSYVQDFFLQKLCHSRGNVEENGTAREAIDDNIMLRRKGGICMPDNSGKNTDTHTHNI